MPTGHFKRTKEHRKNLSLSKTGNRNPIWKGDKVGYTALHAWVKRRLKRPSKCPNCNKRPTAGKRAVLDLANISQQYKRDLSDWEWLCRRCHMLKDGRMELIHKPSKDSKWVKCQNCKKDIWQQKNRKRTFCSNTCKGQAWFGQVRVNRIKLLCPGCSKYFKKVPSDDSVFCSYKCFSSWHKGENHSSWKGGPVKKCCLVCKKTYETSYSLAPKSIACSPRCRILYMNTVYIPKKKRIIKEGKLGGET